MIRSDPLRQEWTTNLPRYWMNNSAFKSHFLNALSVTLPGCERFFIDSVRDYLDDDQVREFVKQEACHSVAHGRYNRWLDEIGLPAARLESEQNHYWHWLNRFHKPWWLAITTAVEHITVIYATVFLEHPELLEQMHPHFREIWQWHSAEEMEHRAVTMDVWKKSGYSHWYRRAAMTLVLPAYFWFVGKNCLKFLAVDGLLWNKETWVDFCDLLFSSRYGVIRRSWSRWMDFYRSDFHPDEHEPVIVPKFIPQSSA